MNDKTEKLINYMFNQLSYASGCLAIMETEIDSGTCVDVNSVKHLQEFIKYTGKELMKAKLDLSNNNNSEVNDEFIHGKTVC